MDSALLDRPATLTHASVKVSLERELLQLEAWPPLTRLDPHDDVEGMARVCALLSRKPTVGFLVARTLGLPQERVRAVLRALHEGHYVRPVGKAQPAIEAVAPRAVVPAEPEPESFIA